MPMSRRVSCHHAVPCSHCSTHVACRHTDTLTPTSPSNPPTAIQGVWGSPANILVGFVACGSRYTNGPNALPAPHYSSGRVEKRVKAERERKLKRQLLHRPTDEARPAGVGPHTHTTKYSTRCRAPFRRGGENSS